MIYAEIKFKTVVMVVTSKNLKSLFVELVDLIPIKFIRNGFSLSFIDKKKFDALMKMSMKNPKIKIIELGD